MKGFKVMGGGVYLFKIYGMEFWEIIWFCNKCIWNKFKMCLLFVYYYIYMCINLKLNDMLIYFI